MKGTGACRRRPRRRKRPRGGPRVSPDPSRGGPHHDRRDRRMRPRRREELSRRRGLSAMPLLEGEAVVTDAGRPAIPWPVAAGIAPADSAAIRPARSEHLRKSLLRLDPHDHAGRAVSVVPSTSHASCPALVAPDLGLGSPLEVARTCRYTQDSEEVESTVEPSRAGFGRRGSPRVVPAQSAGTVRRIAAALGELPRVGGNV
jgi:hypothetical protein